MPRSCLCLMRLLVGADIDGVTPDTSLFGGGALVNISGSNFGTDANEVTLAVTGGAVQAPCAVDTVTDGWLTCVMPAGAAGSANITVTVTGQSATATDAFE